MSFSDSTGTGQCRSRLSRLLECFRDFGLLGLAKKSTKDENDGICTRMSIRGRHRYPYLEIGIVFSFMKIPFLNVDHCGNVVFG